MKLERQDYKDATYAEADRHCDTLQLKYDGWWVRIDIVNGQGRVFTQTQRELEQFSFQLTTEPLNAVLVGELMYGTQWSQDPSRLGKIFLFDCWQVDSTPLEDQPYKLRYAVLRTLQPRLPRNFERVQNFSIQDYEKVWRELVEGGLYEGVVFRDSRAKVGAPILRHKNTFSEDVQVVGFGQGEGKHEGRLGQLLCRLSNGEAMSVGGGFTDLQREEIWANQESYLHRWCSVAGKARFTSGALRHPNFVGWRPVGWMPN